MPLPVGGSSEPGGSLTGTEIATRVKRQFGDEYGAQITDEDIIRWINDAMRDIALRNNLLPIKASTATVANQQDYTLPSDIVTLDTIRYGTTKLRPLTQQEADEFMDNSSTNSGSPEFYSRWGNTISLYPIPTNSTTALSIYYNREPNALTDLSQTPEIPRVYHLRLVEYCIAQAHELDDDTERYNNKMQQFNKNVEDTKDNYNWDARDAYPHISVSADDTMGWAHEW